MSSSKFVSILAFALILQSVNGADPLFHFCSTPENFTASGTYEYNLNKLTASLSQQAPPTGFGLGSVGRSPNKVYGLALCRGDVKSTDCQTCVAEASVEIRKSCPLNKAAIIWYDNCLLKYSNNNFFGQIDDQNKFYLWNVQSVKDPIPFNRKTKQILSQLANQAYVTPNLYATGEMALRNSQKLYGLVQCTRDLSSVDCKKCLDQIISELPSCCEDKEGGRVVSGSCNFRYEIYPFVNKY